MRPEPWEGDDPDLGAAERLLYVRRWVLPAVEPDLVTLEARQQRPDEMGRIGLGAGRRCA